MAESCGGDSVTSYAFEDEDAAAAAPASPAPEAAAPLYVVGAPPAPRFEGADRGKATLSYPSACL